MKELHASKNTKAILNYKKPASKAVLKVQNSLFLTPTFNLELYNFEICSIRSIKLYARK